jgi:pimeloyl-ACP methyl ester carboxylesterase
MEFEVNGQCTYAYTGARAFDPAQQSVLFVHGAGLDHTVWILQSRWFAHHGYNALAIDLPGHGRSAGAAPASIEDIAAWLMQCLDALAIERACLVGHSMGALAVLAAAASSPARVDFAALLGIAVPMPVSDALLAAARDNPADAHLMITLWGHGFAAQIGGNATPGMWMTGNAMRLLARGAPGLLHNDLAACNRYRAGLEHAARVRCPVVLVLGRQDVMAAPRGIAPLRDALAQARVVELDHCGHMLMAEQPDRVLDVLVHGVQQAAQARREHA